MSFYYSFIAGPTVRSKAVEMEVITSVVTDKDTGIRVDIYVARALDISRSYAGNLIKNGKVSMRDRLSLIHI